MQHLNHHKQVTENMRKSFPPTLKHKPSKQIKTLKIPDSLAGKNRGRNQKFLLDDKHEKMRTDNSFS